MTKGAAMASERNIRRVTGQVLREYRTDLGLSQMAMGEKLSITYQQWQKYEGGKSGLSVYRLFQAAAAFKVKPEELIEAVRSRLRKRGRHAPPR
jgi:transcriptional regulator with XRE-family HTH domain